MKSILLLLCFLVCGAAQAAATDSRAAQPVYPLPAPGATGWCTNPAILSGQTKGVSLGPCAAPAMTRITRASIKYPNVPGSGVRTNVDVTKYENIWGHANHTDSAVLFPGRAGATPAVSGWLANRYIAAEFVAPTNTLQYETINYSSYYSGPRLIYAISEREGDFNPSAQYCKGSVGSGESFYKIVSAPFSNGCVITPGRRYYLNLMLQNGVVWNDYISTNLSIGSQPQSCPPGRLMTTQLSLRYDGLGGSVRNMDVTQADNIFGYNSWTDPRMSFPWKQNYTIFWGFPRTAGAYVAAQFTVPVSTPANQSGILQNLETMPGPGTDWALSQVCGDFSPAAQHCASSNVISGRRYGVYKLPGLPATAGCDLQAGGTWYMMFRLTNPAAGGQNCFSTTCRFGVQNNHTP